MISPAVLVLVSLGLVGVSEGQRYPGGSAPYPAPAYGSPYPGSPFYQGAQAPQTQPQWPQNRFEDNSFASRNDAQDPQAAPPPAPPLGSSFQGSGFPQIYKVDNFIIIANPPAAQSCKPEPLIPAQSPDLLNKMGEQPSACTWAVVACCSPGYSEVRYRCFELLGCPGFFFDRPACTPSVVQAATRAAQAFYRDMNASNTTSTAGTSTNSL